MASLSAPETVRTDVLRLPRPVAGTGATGALAALGRVGVLRRVFVAVATVCLGAIVAADTGAKAGGLASGLSRPFGFTEAATTVPEFVDTDAARLERMPVVAVGPTTAAQGNILGVCDRLKVSGVHAAAIVAEVIDDEVVRDGCDKDGVGPPVGVHPTPIDGEASVSAWVKRPVPVPAAGAGIYRVSTMQFFGRVSPGSHSLHYTAKQGGVALWRH